MAKVLKGTELRGRVTRVPGADIQEAAPNLVPPTSASTFPKYFTKTVPPTIHDDVTIGATAFSEWLNTTDNTLYVCASPVKDAATWLLVTTTAF